jgi:hypothetical protein
VLRVARYRVGVLDRGNCSYGQHTYRNLMIRNRRSEVALQDPEVARAGIENTLLWETFRTTPRVNQNYPMSEFFIYSRGPNLTTLTLS